MNRYEGNKKKTQATYSGTYLAINTLSFPYGKGYTKASDVIHFSRLHTLMVLCYT